MRQSDAATTRLSDYLTHLRLPFQFLLSPIFLWGYLLASGRVSWGLVIAYLAFHLFGYAGGTALNSAYDRDEGPIGGLAHPPPAPRHLLAFSIVWQAIGFLLALSVNFTFAAIYAIMFATSLAYSHPRTRWKGHPLRALATVALGQGVLAFLGGWAAARGEIISALNPFALIGALTATLLTVGLYPLTELYQLDEDARRGDMTFARYLGIRGSFRFAMICIVLGGSGAAYIAATLFSIVEAMGLVVLIAALMIWLRRWSACFERRTVLENFATIMRMYMATTLPFLAWIAFHLFILLIFLSRRLSVSRG